MGSLPLNSKCFCCSKKSEILNNQFKINISLHKKNK